MLVFCMSSPASDFCSFLRKTSSRAEIMLTSSSSSSTGTFSSYWVLEIFTLARSAAVFLSSRAVWRDMLVLSSSRLDALTMEIGTLMASQRA